MHVLVLVAFIVPPRGALIFFFKKGTLFGAGDHIFLGVINLLFPQHQHPILQQPTENVLEMHATLEQSIDTGKFGGNL